MGLKCGLVGLPACGKTTIYNAITAAGAASYGGVEMNQATVNVPDSRIQSLIEIYHPSKIVPATLEVVDIPGLKAGSTAGGGHGTKLLGHIKDVEAVLQVVRCFEDNHIPFEYDTINPKRDVETIDLELMVADSQTLHNKINRLSKKAHSGDRAAARELADCEKVKANLDEGIPARKQGLSSSELSSLYECNLVSLKPMLYIANIKSADDAQNSYVKALQSIADAEGSEMIIIRGQDEAEISQLDPEDRPEFLAELGLGESSMERLLRAAYHILGLVSFFTAGDKEVHVWTCRQGDQAPTAAGKIHSDMEKGFIRMEVIHYPDLIQLGSEAAVDKAGKRYLEGKTYQIQDGDIVVVRFNA
ncbi:MAG: redox-regulated ATPase YchF [Dehalococcoidales bacterium]|nr:redox-regulated ATPase YchF [Dehalococcoidales bacterium]